MNIQRFTRLFLPFYPLENSIRQANADSLVSADSSLLSRQSRYLGKWCASFRRLSSQYAASEFSVGHVIGWEHY